MCQHCGCGCDDDDCSCIDEESDAEFKFALVARQASRGLNLVLRQFSQGWVLATRPIKREFALVHRTRTVLQIAAQRGLPVGIPPCSTGRPRRLDYAGLAVMLAAGHSQAEVGRRFGTSRWAVSKALRRNRKLRSSVNRLQHAADLDDL